MIIHVALASRRHAWLKLGELDFEMCLREDKFQVLPLRDRVPICGHLLKLCEIFGLACWIVLVALWFLRPCGMKDDPMK
jgi:hypothetical protein